MAATLGEDNPLRYRGYVYDTETGLYYLKSRYYSPDRGRFINADGYVSTGQGVLGSNMFAYCNNNPVNMVDSTGTVPFRTYSVCMADNGKTIIDITDKLNNQMQEHHEELYSYRTKHGKIAATKYFIEKVKTGGDWDLKSKEEWGLLHTHTVKYQGEILRFDDPGNIHYGYVGQALFGEIQLNSGAGLYQIISGTSYLSYWTSFFDDPRDARMVRYGYAMAFDLYQVQIWR